MVIIEAMVDAGKAKPGPPLGPKLGPLGVNISEIVNEINERTKDLEGKVPVKLDIDTKTKEYTIKVGTPPTTALILKELGIEKGTGHWDESFPSLTMDNIIRVAQIKGDSLSGKTLQDKALEVVGTCVSMRLNVDGNSAKETIRLINEGHYRSVLST